MRKVSAALLFLALLAGVWLMVIRRDGPGAATVPAPRDHPPAVAAAPAVDSAASRLVLLVNANDPESRRIAEHYAAARQVPVANIIALPMSSDETITWPEFLATIWQPLQDELVRRRWLDAMPMALRDMVGRKEYAIAGHRISYLVTCRGVPLRIVHSPELLVARPPPYNASELRTNQGAVDSELSLLAQTNYPINGFVPNPLFRLDHPSDWDLAKVVKVSRLDGPTVDEALALVDQAMAAERTGLLGRAYVDLNGKHPEGDRWLESVVTQLTELGFDLDADRTPNTFPATARFDAPVLYFGWYAGTINGPFMLPGFRFPPGAIAVHIHSFSAQSLHVADTGWTGPFVARGVTATVGNVFEPYLNFLHRPDLLLRALSRGDSFGDAAYYALPVLSWQAIAVGDPLYRPFARKFAEQWQHRANLPPRLAGYAALRKMHLLEISRPNAAVRPMLEDALQAQPNLALGLAVARLREQAGDRPAALRALAFTARMPTLSADEWALAGEAAEWLRDAGDPARAEMQFTQLLQEPGLPIEFQRQWLREAAAAAQAAGDQEQAMAWARELGAISPDEKK